MRGLIRKNAWVATLLCLASFLVFVPNAFASVGCDPPDCEDGISCTIDSCDNGICKHQPQNILCGVDNNYCDGWLRCDVDDGCVPELPPCDDDNKCTDDYCNVSGAQPYYECVNLAKNCTDLFHCTVDSCDEATGECIHTKTDSLCLDSNLCDGTEICDPESTSPTPDSQGCIEGEALDCIDAYDCTDDDCIPATGCVNEENDDNCDDTFSCTDDTCDPSSRAVGDTSGCVFTPVHSRCDDDIDCTDNNCDTDNSSLADGCYYPPDHSYCADTVGCTDDVCNPNAVSPSDGCSNPTNDENCDNGNFCDGEETCVPTSVSPTPDVNGCIPGEDPCEDNIACTVDSCTEQDHCANLADNTECVDEFYCNGAEYCDVSEGCKDGDDIVCTDSVDCTVDECNEDEDKCDFTENNDNCDDSDPCTEDICSGSGCSNPAMSDGSVCDVIPAIPEKCYDGQCIVLCTTDAYCDTGEGSDGIPCTEGTCDMGTGLCVHTPKNSSCDDGDPCNGDEVCDPDSTDPAPDSNGCIDGPDPDCTDIYSCTRDYCDSVFGCMHEKRDSECDNQDVCDGTETCDPEGTDPDAKGCVAGTALTCVDAFDCTDNDCDPTNGCEYTNNDANCNDGYSCTVDTCDPTARGVSVSGCVFTNTNSNCDDSIDCTDNICDPDNSSLTSGCKYPVKADYCNDGHTCTDDSCNPNASPGTGCEYVTHDDKCTDNNICTGIETCEVGKGCVDNEDLDCTDDYECTTHSCHPLDGCSTVKDNSKCSDSKFCTGTEICDPDTAGADSRGCHAGIEPNCADSYDCTIDTCEEDTGTYKCVRTPDDTECDNGVFCDGAETCDVDKGCEDGPVPTCDDGFLCTEDDCDTSTDKCKHEPKDIVCNDDKLCNGEETCNPDSLDPLPDTEGCIDGPDPTCDDGVDCTNDYCNTDVNLCLHDPVNSECSDNDACTTGEYCDEFEGCKVPGTPTCVDQYECTINKCVDNNGTAECTYENNNGACDNDTFCDGMETCQPGVSGADPTSGCLDGASPDCSDAVACTRDDCSSTTDACVNEPHTEDCPDPGLCRVLLVCDPVTGCQYENKQEDTDCSNGGDPKVCRSGVCVPQCVTDSDCNDNTSCSSDKCGDDNWCEYTANNNLCQNDTFCDGEEVCRPFEGCIAGLLPDCSQEDAFTCTYDYCDPVDDECKHEPKDERCYDGKWCSGEESCDPTREGADPASGCFYANKPCDDTIPCTDNLCNEETHECTYVENNDNCSDNLYCNGIEVCDPNNKSADANGCMPGNTPDCTDAFACTADDCVETTIGPDFYKCEFVPDNSKCDDSVDCTTNTCDVDKGCQYDPDDTKCNDDVACTIDSCDKDNDCQFVLDDTKCDDTVACTVDSCDKDNDCQYVPDDTKCNDSVACTVDSCDKDNDCQFVPDNTKCNDSVACTVDSCDKDNDCQFVPDNTKCNDSVSCTVDSCDKDNDCQFVPDDTKCNDSVSCTVDSCDKDNDCQFVPDNTKCNDNVNCTVDVCDKKDDCQNSPVNSNCNDNIVCTIDTCDKDNDCQFDPDDTQCNDGVSCTNDSCDKIKGCEFDPDDTQCNDGVSCTDDTCDLKQDCQFTPKDTNCNDNVGCTNDICDKDQDCQFLPVNTNCNDNISCTIDTCDLKNDCQFTPDDTKCDDGVLCTINSCDKLKGCEYEPDDTKCDNGKWCDGVETCDKDNDCQDGTPKECKDNVDCTVDSCNEEGDFCEHITDDTKCSDGKYCNGIELCSLTKDCYTTSIPNCDDGHDCSTDNCTEITGGFECAYDYDNTECEDNNPCTEPDQCTSEGCSNAPVTDGTACDVDSTKIETCQKGVCVPNCVTADDCDDSVECTTDSCNTNGVCEYVANDDKCNEGNDFCDPLQECLPFQGCQNAPRDPSDPPECNDKIACTVDSCSNLDSECKHDTDDTACDDYNECTVDTCSTTNGCEWVNVLDGTACGDNYECINGICVPPGIDGDEDEEEAEVDAEEDSTDTVDIADEDKDITEKDIDLADGDTADTIDEDKDVDEDIVDTADGDETDGDTTPVEDGDTTTPPEDGDNTTDVDGDDTTDPKEDGDTFDKDAPTTPQIDNPSEYEPPELSSGSDCNQSGKPSLWVIMFAMFVFGSLLRRFRKV